MDPSTPTSVRRRRPSYSRQGEAREQVVIDDSPPPRRRITRRAPHQQRATQAANTAPAANTPNTRASDNQNNNRIQQREVINLITPPQPNRVRTLPAIPMEQAYRNVGPYNPISVDDSTDNIGHDDALFDDEHLLEEEDEDDEESFFLFDSPNPHPVSPPHYHVEVDDDDDDDHEEDEIHLEDNYHHADRHHHRHEDIHLVLSDLQREEDAQTEQERADRELARRLQLEETMLAYAPRPSFRPNIVTRHLNPLNNHRHDAQLNQQQELMRHPHGAEIRRRMFEALNRINQHEPVYRAVLQARNPLNNLHFVDRDFDERDYETLLQLDEQVPNRHKADVKLVNKIPVKEVKQGETFDRCSVCLCDMEVGEMRKELPCEHSFHDQCIDKWLKDYHETCPICKKSLSEMQSQLPSEVTSTSTLNKKRKKDKKNKKNKKRRTNSGAAVQTEA